MSDNMLGTLILLGLIATASFGGVKNYQYENSVSGTNSYDTQIGATTLEQQLALTEAKKNMSTFSDSVELKYVSKSDDANREYIVIEKKSRSTGNVNVTGWTLKSLSSGFSVQIPKGTYLIFADSLNTEDDVILTPGDILYLVTGRSPNGYSFKSNKCSGYMSQFQNFVPYLYTNCPRPKDEDLSSIPNTVINDKCFDLIDNMPSCRIVTTPPSPGLSSECIDFMYNKVNYNSCVNKHKNDSDFYLNEWRVYLKRNDRIWKDRRENIVLLDNEGKLVDSLTY